ncbi:MAG: hypothetical protein ABI433_13440 [Burkholderiaceae bacterium]
MSAAMVSKGDLAGPGCHYRFLECHFERSLQIVSVTPAERAVDDDESAVLRAANRFYIALDLAWRACREDYLHDDDGGEIWRVRDKYRCDHYISVWRSGGSAA